ncbi:hypothetical protein IG631_19144 [Alternaria alternata]|nr:hypothetical protein IG631_19144 [Alternaria alternata]
MIAEVVACVRFDIDLVLAYRILILTQIRHMPQKINDPLRAFPLFQCIDSELLITPTSRRWVENHVGVQVGYAHE